MTTPPDETALRPLALTSISASLNILTGDLMDRGLNTSDDGIWIPAKRAFLEALIREAQLELAEADSGTPPIKVIAASHSRLSLDAALKIENYDTRRRYELAKDNPVEHDTPT